MAISFSCSQCRATIRVREDYVGRNMQCPKCSAVVVVPSAEEPALITVVEPQVKADAPPASPRPGRVVSSLRTGKPSKYKPCPQCGASGAERVRWTPWGSFFGPKMFTHVRCPDCGYAYNGRTGGSNLIPAILMVLIPLVGILLLLWWIYGTLRDRNWI
jgi:predicted RNA-binding Zn-ribbon protein involved in translation (DUF1610 family)